MSEAQVTETAGTIGAAAQHDPNSNHSLSSRLLALAVVGGGAIVTFVWVAALVYALIMILF